MRRIWKPGIKRLFLALGGLVGIVGIIGLILALLPILQTERDAAKGAEANATLIAIQEEQLSSLKQMATLQANNPDTAPTVTVIALRLTEMSNEQEALIRERDQIASTITAIANNMSALITQTPTPSILFRADFESGVPDGMNVVFGEVRIVNGKLIAEEPTLLSIGNETWKDYEVEYETSKHAYCWGLMNNAVAAHATDARNMVVWSWNYCESAWFEIANGISEQIEGSHQGNVANPGATIRIRLVAEDGNFSIYINNEKRTSYADGRYLEGKAYIILGNGSMVDNIRIRSLP